MRGSIDARKRFVNAMVCTPAPGMLKLMMSAPGFALAAIDRFVQRTQLISSQVSLPGSNTLLTVKVLAAGTASEGEDE